MVLKWEGTRERQACRHLVHVPIINTVLDIISVCIQHTPESKLSDISKEKRTVSSLVEKGQKDSFTDEGRRSWKAVFREERWVEKGKVNLEGSGWWWWWGGGGAIREKTGERKGKWKEKRGTEKKDEFGEMIGGQNRRVALERGGEGRKG